MRIVVLCMSLFLLSQISTSFVHAEDVIKIGIIGLDSSHATEFTKMINAEKQDEEFKGFRVVAAYPQGSKDIPTSMEKVPSYIESVKANGVEIVDSIPELIKRVDVVLVETNDGKPHLEQVTPVLKAGKPVFVDKPVAGTLADVLEVYKLAEEYKTPIFSSSSLRYTNGLKALKKEDVTSCYTFSPCPLEKSHPDFYWYGIHGVEMLYTVMETGCVSVSRSSTTTNDIATGVWKDGRVGTYNGRRSPDGKHFGGYGGVALTKSGITDLGKFDGYKPLLVEVVKFFKTKKAPVSVETTIEIYAFMEAADESKRRGGAPVTLKEVIEKAEKVNQERKR